MERVEGLVGAVVMEGVVDAAVVEVVGDAEDVVGVAAKTELLR